MSHNGADWLDKHGVTTHLRSAMGLVLENRPAQPIEFLADYFRGLVEGTSPLKRSYEYVRMSPLTCEAFMDNVHSAYMALERPSTSGLPATAYQTLIEQVCADFPKELLAVMLSVLGRTSGDLVTFEEFAGGITACILYEDFLNIAAGWFSETAGADKAVAEDSKRDETWSAKSPKWAAATVRSRRLPVRAILNLSSEELAAHDSSDATATGSLQVGTIEHLAGRVPGIAATPSLRTPSLSGLTARLQKAAGKDAMLSFDEFVSEIFAECAGRTSR